MLDVEHIAEHLYTKGQPDPDLVIRTSGEQRLGGFLLWQSAQSEFYFCEAYWPDFRRVDFLRAVRAYARARAALRELTRARGLLARRVVETAAHAVTHRSPLRVGRVAREASPGSLTLRVSAGGEACRHQEGRFVIVHARQHRRQALRPPAPSRSELESQDLGAECACRATRG